MLLIFKKGKYHPKTHNMMVVIKRFFSRNKYNPSPNVVQRRGILIKLNLFVKWVPKIISIKITKHNRSSSSTNRNQSYSSTLLH